MLKITHNLDNNTLVVQTDDPNDHLLLETKFSEYKYRPWTKDWGPTTTTIKIYNPGRHSIKGGLYRYELGLGWAAYLLGVFKDKLSADNYNYIIDNIIRSDSSPRYPFHELRDYQNDDVLFLLKYRIGLMTVNTGYGKTQTIATLTNYARNVLGKKVLIVCPGNKARDEIVKRCKSVFGLDVSSKEKDVNGELDCIITSGLSNSGRTKDGSKSNSFKKTLASYDWVLADEVEYTINAGGEFIYRNCINAERFYGFSGTADKTMAEAISFSNGLSDVVVRNKDLIKYFGPSLIYRMPLNIDLSFVRVKSKSMDDLSLDFEKIEKSSNVYLEMMNQIWTDPGICNSIVNIVKHYPLCFIPINNLVNILSLWIEKYFIGTFKILLVCGEGYVYYDLDGNKTVLTLEQACDYIKSDKVDVIPSTSSGYRALDLPRLENICLFAGKLAGVTLQSIGRCARGKHMNIITLEGYSERKIPVYTKGVKERNDMIKNYYQYCNMTEEVIEECNL